MTFDGTEVCVVTASIISASNFHVQSTCTPVFGVLRVFNGLCKVELPTLEPLSLSHFVLFHKVHINSLR